MCGIAGQLSLDGQMPADASLLHRMTDIISHRGPDGEGHYLHGPVGLGHRRLSIIDVAAGKQPMCNEDETVWVTFNGEIYNYQSLRDDLLARGHLFKTSSDTEVIVHAYEEFGEDCVSKLHGMFAFAIWDERKRSLFLARDRVGIKPLYFTLTRDRFLFASEIKSLLQDPAVPRQFNPKSIDRFLTYYYAPGEDTLFEGIQRLEPGHTLVVRQGQLVKRQYWDLHFDATTRFTRFDDAVDALNELMAQTVRQHLISDVPVGVLLSGGVDSTAVLAYAAETGASSLQSFTVGFEGEAFVDERPYARLAAQQFGALQHEITINHADFGALLSKYTWHMEEPVCEPPAIAMYAISQHARDSGVKVLLSGEGSDEAFGGYNKYSYILALERLKSLFGRANNLLYFGLNSMAAMGLKSLHNFKRLIDVPLASYYLSCTSTPYTTFNTAKSALYRTGFLDALGPHVSDAPTRQLFHHARELPTLHQMLRVDTKTWLPDDLLIKADKMTMAASVELRVPFLDARVLEFAASLPADFKVRGWPPKRILRAALKNKIPEPILKRKKVGFPVPYDRWLRNELKDMVHDTIYSRRGGLTDYFNREAMLQVTESHLHGQGNSQEVFCLLVLALMGEQFLNQPLQH